MNVETAPTENNLQVNQTEWDKLGDPIELLRSTAVDMVKCAEGELADSFPSGVYMYHGATMETIEEIFASGAIMNAGALQLQVSMKNSGQEGISWSVNGIDALPGTQGHIAGFVAAPEKVLGNDKLVIPSRPAPYELLQVPEEMDAERFYEVKKQFEIWGYEYDLVSEKSSVKSGLMFLYIVGSGKYKDEGFNKSLLYDFARRGGLSAEELRSHYKIMESGQVKIDDSLLQQKHNDEQYLPPAAVWMQYMIDSGEFDGAKVGELNVNHLVEMVAKDGDLAMRMLNCAIKQGKKYENDYKAELEKLDDVAVPVGEMYLVSSHHDLDHWLEVIRRTGHTPRGILLYDDEKVVKPNFAQREPGDHGELAGEIGRVIGADDGFWSEKMTIDVKSAPRAGSRGQVLAESAVKCNKEIRMVNEKLVIGSS